MNYGDKHTEDSLSSRLGRLYGIEGRFPLPHDTGTEETGKSPYPPGVLQL